MVNRALYYWSRIFSEQLKEGQNYKALYPVISINIMHFNLLKETDAYHNIFRLYEMEKQNQEILTHNQEIKMRNQEIREKMEEETRRKEAESALEQSAKQMALRLLEQGWSMLLLCTQLDSQKNN